MAKQVKKVAFLTAGGLAPCLSASIGFLIDEYTKRDPSVEMIGYINGYMGLLKGDSIPVTAKRLAASKAYDAVVGLGAVVQGATAHAGLICETTARAFTEIALETGVPVTDGVVAAENLEQAVERCGTKQGNKGFAAMQAAIELANVLKQI